MPRARVREVPPLQIQDFADRLRTMFEIRADDECWPFIGVRGTSVVQERGTYGQINLGVKYNRFRMTVPRAMLIWRLGRDLRPGMVVCHLCDWRPCCNPWHLMEGTESQNQQMVDPEVKRRSGMACKGVPKNGGRGVIQPLRECECGLRVNYGGMTVHLRASGHSLRES